MTPRRKKVIGKVKIEEYYWHGDFVTYIDNGLFKGTFERACTVVNQQKILKELP